MNGLGKCLIGEIVEMEVGEIFSAFKDTELYQVHISFPLT